MRRCLAVLTCSLLILSTAALAQETVRAQGNVNLRADRPRAPFFRNAKSLDIVKTGELLTVLERQEIFSTYEWLRVERQLDTKQKVGWVYNGEDKNKPYFKAVNQP